MKKDIDFMFRISKEDKLKLQLLAVKNNINMSKYLISLINKQFELNPVTTYTNSNLSTASKPL